MNAGDPETDLSTVLARSRSADPKVRSEAIPELGKNIEYGSARMRLEEIMVGDAIVTMRVDAAEQLTRFGGQDGLLAVLHELGRRHGDADVDYTAYMLSELDNFDEFPVLDKALALDEGSLSSEAKLGLRDLRRLMHR